MNAVSIDDYAIKYIAGQTQGKKPEEICTFYIQNFVFKNEGYLEHLIKTHKLPSGDFLKLDKRIHALARELET